MLFLSQKRILDPMLLLSQKLALRTNTQIRKEKNYFSRARRRLLKPRLFFLVRGGVSETLQHSRKGRNVWWVRNGLLCPMRFSSQKWAFGANVFIESKNEFLKPRCFSIQNRAFGASAQSGRGKRTFPGLETGFWVQCFSWVRKGVLEAMHRLKKEKMSFPEPETGFWSQRVSRVRNGYFGD